MPLHGSAPRSHAVAFSSRSVTGLCEAGGYAALIYGIERSGKSSVFNAYVAMQVPQLCTPACWHALGARAGPTRAWLGVNPPPTCARTLQVLVILSPNLIQAAMYWLMGKVFSFSPDLVRGRKLLRGWVITTIFAAADLFALV